MYKKILVPLDNSHYDKAILNHIVDLTKLTKAHVVLIHVAEGYGARLQDDLNLKDSEEIQDDRAYLLRQKERLSKEGLQVEAVLVKGEPAVQILNVAQKEKCDLIAMSTHGHRFFKDLILGSVADKIRHQTDIPILMIRGKAE